MLQLLSEPKYARNRDFEEFRMLPPERVTRDLQSSFASQQTIPLTGIWTIPIAKRILVAFLSASPIFNGPLSTVFMQLQILKPRVSTVPFNLIR
jgi:hypothetical protein